MKPSYKYHHALKNIPAPGGNGCHPYLLTIANHGVHAGFGDQQLFNDMRRNIPPGTRVVTDGEILDAIATARRPDQPTKKTKGGRKTTFVKNSNRTILKPEDARTFIKNGEGTTEDMLLEASPVTILAGMLPCLSTLQLLKAIYDDNDYLFIGENDGKYVATVADWNKAILASKNVPWPHIIPNPVTGHRHPRKDGKLSYRCDAAVKDFRIAIAEFDDLSKPDQLAFWAGSPLPIYALIDSGGKSIHAWIKVCGIQTNEDWTKHIEIGLYRQRLVPMGMDPQCRNESRLSRLPGHYRSDKGNWQKLLYLDPDPDRTPIIERIRAKGEGRAQV